MKFLKMLSPYITLATIINLFLKKNDFDTTLFLLTVVAIVFGTPASLLNNTFFISLVLHLSAFYFALLKLENQALKVGRGDLFKVWAICFVYTLFTKDWPYKSLSRDNSFVLLLIFILFLIS